MDKGSVHFRILCAVPNNRASVFPFFRLRISSFSLNQAESSAMAFDNFASGRLRLLAKIRSHLDIESECTY